MEVYIFDKTLNFEGLLEGYYSFIWRRRYSSCGDFELHCSLTNESLNLLRIGNIVWKNDDLEAAYIESRELKKNNEGSEILVVRGKFLTAYLERRIVWSVEDLDTSIESVIRTLIDNNSINSSLERKLPFIELGSLKGYLEQIKYKNGYSNLLEEVETLANIGDLGIRSLVDMQSKKILIDIYKGEDRSSNQLINDPIIFSQEFENILEQEFTESINNYKNVALIESEDIVTRGESLGLDRFEVYVDANDLKKESLTSTEYSEKLKERGSIILSEYKEIKTFESKINLDSSIRYKEDFDIGDLVTCVSKKWGVSIDTKITEIEEVYEEDGLTIKVTFGAAAPTLLKKIRQVIK